jgi:hypothetical protein
MRELSAPAGFETLTWVKDAVPSPCVVVPGRVVEGKARVRGNAFLADATLRTPDEVIAFPVSVGP